MIPLSKHSVVCVLRYMGQVCPDMDTGFEQQEVSHRVTCSASILIPADILTFRNIHVCHQWNRH
jgi:hypothetical protein